MQPLLRGARCRARWSTHWTRPTVSCTQSPRILFIKQCRCSLSRVLVVHINSNVCETRPIFLWLYKYVYQYRFQPYVQSQLSLA